MDNQEIKYLIHVFDSRNTAPHLYTYHFDPKTYLTETDLDSFLNYTGDLQRILYIQELIFIDPTRIPNIDIDKFQTGIIWMFDTTGCVDYSRYKQVEEFVIRYKIKPEHTHILVNARYDFELVKSIFTDPKITITEFNYGEIIALREVCFSTKEKRFLALNRSMSRYRLFNFVDLHRRGVLKNSYFSFFNIKDIYGDRKNYYTLEELDLLFYEAMIELDDSVTKEEIQDYWSDNKKDIFAGMPYSLDGEIKEVGKIAHQVISNTLHNCFSNSYFSLLTETHMFYDNAVDNSYFSMTEKTSKAVYYRHPFVIYSDANFLKRFRQSNYKTFSSVINEDYDSIMKPLERILAINDQVSILNDMDIITFKKHMFDLSDVAAHNYKTLIDHYTNLPSRVISSNETSVISDMIVKNTDRSWF
jgi:hypothetical protein